MNLWKDEVLHELHQTPPIDEPGVQARKHDRIYGSAPNNASARTPGGLACSSLHTTAKRALY